VSPRPRSRASRSPVTYANRYARNRQPARERYRKAGWSSGCGQCRWARWSRAQWRFTGSDGQWQATRLISYDHEAAKN
jgi:hypothetical protein